MAINLNSIPKAVFQSKILCHLENQDILAISSTNTLLNKDLQELRNKILGLATLHKWSLPLWTARTLLQHKIDPLKIPQYPEDPDINRRSSFSHIMYYSTPNDWPCSIMRLGRSYLAIKLQSKKNPFWHSRITNQKITEMVYFRAYENSPDQLGYQFGDSRYVARICNEHHDRQSPPHLLMRGCPECPFCIVVNPKTFSQLISGEHPLFEMAPEKIKPSKVIASAIAIVILVALLLNILNTQHKKSL